MLVSFLPREIDEFHNNFADLSRKDFCDWVSVEYGIPDFALPEQLTQSTAALEILSEQIHKARVAAGRPAVNDKSYVGVPRDLSSARATTNAMIQGNHLPGSSEETRALMKPLRLPTSYSLISEDLIPEEVRDQFKPKYTASGDFEALPAGTVVWNMPAKAVERDEEEELQIKVRYTVSILFDPTLNRLRMIHKEHGPYTGTFNGIGGKIENSDSSPRFGALRELKEEAGIYREDLLLFKWLTTIILPPGVELHVYYGVLKMGSQGVTRTDEDVLWVSRAEAQVAADTRFAGDGNVAWFVTQALANLKESGYIPTP